MDYLQEGWRYDQIAGLFRLPPDDIQAAIAYIEAHKEEVMTAEAALQASNTPSSLPVLTISEPERLLSSRAYAHRVVERLVEHLIDIETLRGTGRLYLP